MKKIVIAIMLLLIGTQASANSLSTVSLGDIGSEWRGFRDRMREVTSLFDKAMSVCYVPDRQRANYDINICDYLKNVPKIDMCKALPLTPPGYKRKENILLNNKDLIDICNDVTNGIKSTISDLDIFINEADGKIASGKSVDEFYNNISSPKELLGNPSSISYHALIDGNQAVLKEIINQGKKMASLENISKINIKDLSAPKDYNSYLKERDGLSKIMTDDYINYSPLTVSSSLRGKLKDREGEDLSKDVNEDLEKVYEVVDKNTKRRSQVYLDILAKDDDFAIPTQQMVDIMKEDVKPEIIAKMKKQLKREALIMAELNQIDNARKNLLQISGNKAIVMSRKFNREDAKAHIDSIIQ